MNTLSKAIIETLGIKGITSAKIEVGSYSERPKLLLEMDYSLIQAEVIRRMVAMQQSDAGQSEG